jgi:uncharacterized protein
MVKHLIYKDKVVADIFIADTFMKRFLGYMFRKKPHHEAILINPCSSIHTYFMKFNIDVLFLNENMKVIRKIDKLEPSRVIMPVKASVMVIEAEAGRFTEVAVGDKVTLL